jgi:hypothetical protein
MVEMQKLFEWAQAHYYDAICSTSPGNVARRAEIEKFLVRVVVLLQRSRKKGHGLLNELLTPAQGADFFKWAVLDDVDRIFRVQPDENDKRAKLVKALTMIRPPESWDQFMTLLSIFTQWTYIKQDYALYGPQWFSCGPGLLTQQRFVKLLSIVLTQKSIAFTGEFIINRFLRPHLVVIFDNRMEYQDEKAWDTWLDWCVEAAKAAPPPQPP